MYNIIPPPSFTYVLKKSFLYYSYNLEYTILEQKTT